MAAQPSSIIQWGCKGGGVGEERENEQEHYILQITHVYSNKCIYKHTRAQTDRHMNTIHVAKHILNIIQLVPFLPLSTLST